jgi:hypothetical protein
LKTLLIVSQLSAQIGEKVQEQSSIIGAWRNSDFQEELILVLNKDGSGTFDGKRLTYKVIGDNLTITQGTTDVVYTFHLDVNSLELSGGDLEAALTFSRNPTERIDIKLEEVKIGNQIWSTRNLDVGTFKNGEPIPEAKSADEWESAGKSQMPCWCYYLNDIETGPNMGDCTIGTR